MIIRGSRLVCIDNSGATLVTCINTLSNTKQKYVTVGHIIKVIVAKYKNIKRKPHISKRDYKKSLLNLKKSYFGVVVSVRKKVRRQGNFFFKADKNKTVLLTNSKNLIGKRFKSYVSRDLALPVFLKKHNKVLLMAKHII